MAWQPQQGADAEQQAEHWCRQQGWQIMARNYRVKQGEIDLICLDQAILVFIEVRKRSSDRFGGAAASITPFKQSKLIKAAQRFLQQHPHEAHRASRFDAITLNGQGRIDWIKSAFTL